MAWLVAHRKVPRTIAAAWNLVGLALLGNTIFVVVTSVPGPLNLEWAGGPFAEFASWRLICVPAFLAPLAVFMHIASLRQNLGGAPAVARGKNA